MKIIFCICLLSVTAVSVSPGQSEELNGIVGQSVKFPTAVENIGSLIFSSKAIADVTNGMFKHLPNEKFTGRLQWDSSTGFFSLSELKMNDSGVYKVQNSDGQKSLSTFQLTVWKDYVPVSKPNASVTHNKYPCKLMCTVERGTGVTLSWYREGEEERYIHTHPLSAPDLKLPVPLDKGGIYTCEAKNSVSNETSDPITVGGHCRDGAAGIWQTGGSLMWNLCLVLIVTLYSFLL